MRTVYKYPIYFGPLGHIFLESYTHFKPLKVGVQDGKPYLWAEVITTSCPKEQTIRIVGTEYIIPDDPNVEYIDTFFDGPIVGHVYFERS